jgi:hypothetical protein
VKLETTFQTEKMRSELQYTLQSLRNQYAEATDDESREVIAAMGKATRLQLEALPAPLPRIAEIEVATPGLPGTLVEAILDDLKDFLNIGKNINPQQAIQTANLIVEAFPTLTIEHIAVVAHRAKTGYYKVFDRLDGQVLCLWIRQYDEELREGWAQNQRLHHESLPDRRSADRPGGMRSINELF